MDFRTLTPASPVDRILPASVEFKTEVPWLDRVRVAITKRPISERCNDLSNLISEGIANNSKDLLTCLVAICEDCFELRPVTTLQDSGWGLKTTTRNISSYEFDRLVSFFSATGPFLQLLTAVCKESAPFSEFPIAKLPVCVRQSLEKSVVPAFFTNKHLPNSPVLHLRPLEFVLFSFISYLQNDGGTGQLSFELAAIFPIFESWLTFFIPVSNDAKPVGNETTSPNSLWESLSSTTSTLLHLTPAAQTPVKPSLISAKQFRQTGFQSPVGPAGDDSDSDFGSKTKCRTFITIFNELMLTVPDSNPNQKRVSPINMHNRVQLTSDQVRCVRIFVKHLHLFANSCPGEEAMKDPQYRLGTSPLDDLKRGVWSIGANLQSRLYSYLKFCFDTWPSDASFRMPVETWLSYIQPWRYKNVSGVTSGREDEDENERSEISIGSEWISFVMRNLPFYSNMFARVVQRLNRFDLMSSKNSVIVFRVLRVFSTSRMTSVIREAEEQMAHKDQSPRTPARNPILKNRPPVPSPTHMTHLIKHNFQECEELEPDPMSLFSGETMNAICDLYLQVQAAEKMLLQEQASLQSTVNQSGSSRGFFGFFMSFLDAEEEQHSDLHKNLSELKRIENHLSFSRSRMEAIFGLDLFQSHCSQDQIDGEISRKRMSSPSFSSSRKPAPDVVLSPDGMRVLSPVGRKQLLNRLAKSDISFEGNPDLQPTRSYEIEVLVNLLIWMAHILNQQIGPFLEQHYFSESPIGKLLQMILAPPVSYTKVSKSGMFGETRRSIEHLPPRISLRRFADYRILTLLCIFFSLSRITGLSFFPLMLFSSVGVLIAAFMSFAWDKIKSL